MPKQQVIEIIARGVSIHAGRLLVCRNLDGGYCYLPGGHVEFSEPAAQALVRELDEEAAIEARVGALLLTMEHSFDGGSGPHHELNLVFHVEQLGGVTLGSGSDDPPTVESREPEIGFEWVDLAAVQDINLRPLAMRAWLAAGMPETPGGVLSSMNLPVDV